MGYRTDLGRCRRYDDGTLLMRRDATGRTTPVPLPAAFGPAELVVEPAPAGDRDAAVLSPGDGQSVPVTLRVRNPGPGPAYWLRIRQERGSRDPSLFTPPPRLIRLDPGATWEPTAAVSYLAAGHAPRGREGKLKLYLEQARGDPIAFELPIRDRAPELELVGEPEHIEGDTSTLTVRLRNAGEQALQEAEFRARISDSERPLARVTEDELPAGAEIVLPFSLPEGVARRGQPPHPGGPGALPPTP